MIYRSAVSQQCQQCVCVSECVSVLGPSGTLAAPLRKFTVSKVLKQVCCLCM